MTFRDLILTIVDNIINPLAFFFVVAIITLFFYKSGLFILNTEDKDNQRRKLMFFGFISIAVVASIWGIVNLIIGVLIPSSGGSNEILNPSINNPILVDPNKNRNNNPINVNQNQNNAPLKVDKKPSGNNDPINVNQNQNNNPLKVDKKPATNNNPINVDPN